MLAHGRMCNALPRGASWPHHHSSRLHLVDLRALKPDTRSNHLAETTIKDCGILTVLVMMMVAGLLPFPHVCMGPGTGGGNPLQRLPNPTAPDRSCITPLCRSLAHQLHALFVIAESGTSPSRKQDPDSRYLLLVLVPWLSIPGTTCSRTTKGRP